MRIMSEALLILMLIIFVSPVLQASPELSIQEEVRDIILNDSSVQEIVNGRDRYDITIKISLYENEYKEAGTFAVISFPEEDRAYGIFVNLEKGIVENIYYGSPGENLFFRKEAGERYKYDWKEEGISKEIKEIALDSEEIRGFFEDEHKIEIREFFRGEDLELMSPGSSFWIYDEEGDGCACFVDLNEGKIVKIFHIHPSFISNITSKLRMRNLTPDEVKYWFIPFLILVVLLILGIIGLILKNKLKWTGSAAAWAFYLPTILGIVAPMIVPFLGAGILYLLWEPIRLIPQLGFLRMGIYPYPISPIKPIIGKIIRYIGFILIISGLGINITGLWRVIKARRKNEGLVKTGLYSISRHPQYWAFIGWTLGIILISPIPRVIDFFAWSILVLLHLFLADSEESNLRKEKEFGKEYEEYCEEVPYIPFLKITLKFIPKAGLDWGRKFFVVGVYIIFTAIMLRIVLIFATWPC